MINAKQRKTTMNRFNKEEKTLIAATTILAIAFIATAVWGVITTF